MTTPQTMHALVVGGAGRYELDPAVPVPQPGPGMVLVAVKAVALNPADWKIVDFSAKAASIGGHEFAGEVVAAGPGVTAFRPGDRVLAPVAAAGYESGAFCEYTLVAEDMAARLPDSMSFEDAAGLSVATSTVTLALYQKLKLPLPVVHDGVDAGAEGVAPATATSSSPDKPFYVLVSGGATATGTIAIQFLKASGLAPIATCSPDNREMLLRLGAVETFDYHSPACGMEIRNYTHNGLAHVLDCVTQAESMKLAYEAIGPAGGHYVALDPFPTRIAYTRREVIADWIISFTLFGKPVKLAGAFGRPARPQDRVFTAAMFLLISRMLAAGMLRPHPIELRTGGLPAINAGIEDLRMGRVRARKLVYPVV